MAIDLKSMSRKDLLKLQKDVDKALKKAEQRDRAAALRAAEEAVAQFGFSLGDVSGSAKGKGAKALPKYCNPADPTQTWTGRGRKPAWIHEALANGADITDLEIK